VSSVRFMLLRVRQMSVTDHCHLKQQPSFTFPPTIYNLQFIIPLNNCNCTFWTEMVTKRKNCGLPL